MSNEEFEDIFFNVPFENIEKIKRFINENYVSKDELKKIREKTHEILDKNGITRGYQILIDEEFNKILEEE